MNTKDLQERILFCQNVLQEIRPVILDGFQNPRIVSERKKDGSEVTEIDRRVEELVCKKIMQEFPGESIVGEEFGQVEGQTDFTWYVDPIDGTRSFVSGVPLFGSMIGIVQGQQSLLGYIELPALGESISAYQGGGAYWQSSFGREKQRCQVSSVAEVSEALFCTSSRDYFREAQCVEDYDLLASQSHTTRGWGDCYGHILVATGRADFMVDPLCADWDSVPLQVIIEESGGVFSDYRGERSCMGKSMVSANPQLHSKVMQLLKS